MIALGAIWVRTYQMAWAAWRAETNELAKTLLYGIVLATVTLHLQSVVHFSYRSNATYYLLQVMIGVLVGIYCARTESRSRRAHTDGSCGTA